MIEKIGIGIDIVEVEQFIKIPYPKKPTFYEKIFLPSEIEYCLKFKNPYQHFAGKFAIKEALKKSILNEINLLDIETSYSNSKPIVNIKDNEKYNFLVSVSHEHNIAVAIVIAERIN